jgi:hypothetical protein
MKPGTYLLELYRGDSHAWRFVMWEDKDKTIANILTGSTVAAEIRDKTSGALLISPECTVSDPNIVDMLLPATAWAGWDPSRTQASWDLQVTYPTEEVVTMLAGAVVITRDITGSTTP